MDPRQLKLTKMCDADWDAMDGDLQRRRCARCNKEVHNLAVMTERQARLLLESGRQRGELPCVRYAVADGRVQYQPESPRSRGRLIRAASALGLLSLPGTAMASEAGWVESAVATAKAALVELGWLDTPPQTAIRTDDATEVRTAALAESEGQDEMLSPSRTEELVPVEPLRVGHASIGEPTMSEEIHMVMGVIAINPPANPPNMVDVFKQAEQQLDDG